MHTSQGSEFDDVVVLLPEHPSRVLTRELLYTAVIRARRSVTFFGAPDIIRHAVERRVERVSGLRERLWDAARWALYFRCFLCFITVRTILPNARSFFLFSRNDISWKADSRASFMKLS